MMYEEGKKMNLQVAFTFMAMFFSTLVNAAAFACPWEGLKVRTVNSANVAKVGMHRIFYTTVSYVFYQEDFSVAGDRFDRFTTRPHIFFEALKSGNVVGQLLVNSSTGSIDILSHRGKTPQEKKIIRAALLAAVALFEAVPIPKDVHYVTSAPKEDWQQFFGFEQIDEGSLDMEKVVELYKAKQKPVPEKYAAALASGWRTYGVDRRGLYSSIEVEFPGISEVVERGQGAVGALVSHV